MNNAQRLTRFETLSADLALVHSWIDELQVTHTKYKSEELADAITHLRSFLGQLLVKRQELREELLDANNW